MSFWAGRASGRSTSARRPDNPSGRPYSSFTVGEIVSGRVSNLGRHGAFVDIGGVRDAWLSFTDPRRASNLTIGDRLSRLTVLQLDEKQRRIVLSWPERSRADASRHAESGRADGWGVVQRRARSRSSGAVLCDEASGPACPVCSRPKDEDDACAPAPCPCGYAPCVWCVVRIRESLGGLCPACREPYREGRALLAKVAVQDLGEVEMQSTAPRARVMQVSEPQEASQDVHAIAREAIARARAVASDKQDSGALQHEDRERIEDSTQRKPSIHFPTKKDACQAANVVASAPPWRNRARSRQGKAPVKEGKLPDSESPPTAADARNNLSRVASATARTRCLRTSAQFSCHSTASHRSWPVLSGRRRVPISVD